MIAHVALKCPDCSATRTLYVIDIWNIKDVKHSCGKSFVVTFDPPRNPTQEATPE